MPRTPAGDEESGGPTAGGKAPSKPTSPPAPVHMSTLQELSHAIRTNQWRSLFSGLSASLVGTTVSQGIYFYLYSLLRQAAVRRRAGARAAQDARSIEITVADSLFVAALAGMGNVLLTNPIWMVATRMQTHQRRQSTHPAQEKGASDSRRSGEVAPESHTPAPAPAPAPGPVAVARDVYAEYGVGGFWNGCGASLVMVINPTIQYALYEWLSAARARVVAQRRGGKPARPSALEVFLLSAVAKAGATVVTYPLLTVKTRMMSARKGDADMQYTSVADAIAQIAKKEGEKGEKNGTVSCLSQMMPAGPFVQCVHIDAWSLFH